MFMLRLMFMLELVKYECALAIDVMVIVSLGIDNDQYVVLLNSKS